MRNYSYKSRLREASNREIRRFNSITIEQIEDRLDCTVLSGPHNDKTGPCYCIDNHDHEIQILHMQEILEVFEEPELITVALIEDGVRSDIDCLEEIEGNENVFEYVAENGRCSIVAVTGTDAIRFFEDVVDVADAVSYHVKCDILAISRRVCETVNRKGHMYDVEELIFDDEFLNNYFIDLSSVEVPMEVKMINSLALKGLGSSFRRI